MQVFFKLLFQVEQFHVLYNPLVTGYSQGIIVGLFSTKHVKPLLFHIIPLLNIACTAGVFFILFSHLFMFRVKRKKKACTLSIWAGPLRFCVKLNYCLYLCHPQELPLTE